MEGLFGPEYVCGTARQDSLIYYVNRLTPKFSAMAAQSTIFEIDIVSYNEDNEFEINKHNTCHFE